MDLEKPIVKDIEEGIEILIPDKMINSKENETGNDDEENEEDDEEDEEDWFPSPSLYNFM
jgi:hypothetical protein